MSEKKRTTFQQALTDAVLLRYQETIDADKEPVEFSETHQAYVAKLTKKTRRKTWKYVNTTAKRILIAAILILLLTATAFAAVPALREGLLRFFMHDDGVAYKFEFSKEDREKAPKVVETYYAPSYVPDGLTLVQSGATDIDLEFIYLDEETGYVFAYTQNVLWAVDGFLDDPPNPGAGLNVSSENTTLEIRIVDGYEVKILRETIYSLPDQPVDYTIVWTDHEYFYEIIATNLSNEELERVITSMQPIERPAENQ